MQKSHTDLPFFEIFFKSGARVVMGVHPHDLHMGVGARRQDGLACCSVRIERCSAPDQITTHLRPTQSFAPFALCAK